MIHGCRRFGLALVGLLALASPAIAHEGRPVLVLVRETEPDTFLVTCRVPKTIPARAMPFPVLPDHCRPEGERLVLDRAGNWLSRQTYRCPGGIAGRTIGIRYPVLNPSLSTVVRVELLSGERYAHALAPGETSWRVPRTGADRVGSLLREARRAALDGARHVLGHPSHLLFLLVIVLLGGVSASLRLVTAFAAGQIAGLLLSGAFSPPFEPALADALVSVAVVLLAREALVGAADPRRLAGLGVGAGLFHGLALAGPAIPATGLPAVLGMDAALLLLAAGAAGLGRVVARRLPTPGLRRAALWLAGGLAVAAALDAVAEEREADAYDTRAQASLPGTLDAGAGLRLAGSRRVAPSAPEAPIRCYLAVEPMEVRHEVLLRLGDLAARLEAEVADGHVEIPAQPGLLERAGRLLTAHAVVEIDGKAVGGIVDRVDFLVVDPTGVRPRTTPVREAVEDAIVGVTVVYPVPAIPGEMRLTWTGFLEEAPSIPVTVIDPESSLSSTLTAARASVRWTNELTEAPPTAVAPVAVEPRVLPLPTLSLFLLVPCGVLAVRAVRGRRPALSFAAARVLLALAVVAGPVLTARVALPETRWSRASEGEARRVVAGLLPNVYRALSLRDEAAAYDRLAVAVTGETLTDVYLGHRQVLEMEERGGARARVEAVEVLGVRDVRPRDDGGFTADAAWTVGGTVTHFGHRHFRQNRHDARVVVLPVEGVWKIGRIDMLEKERTR